MKANLSRRYVALLGAASVFVLLLSSIVFSEPSGPDTITDRTSGQHTNFSGPIALNATAGNVTALVIASVRSTQTWQGYYGNITGTITLDDGFNQTLYDWSLPNPQGEVYASNESVVSWANVYCMNVSGKRNISGTEGVVVGPGSSYNRYSINGSQIELKFGINSSDLDGLNETFNDTYTDVTGFKVGGITIDNADACSSTHPYTTQAYNYDHATGTGWTELLLSDNASLIFTGLIRDNANGFQAGATDTYDFQLFVLDNGHIGSVGTGSIYYFFVELS